jgi:hypothetical protein
MRLDTKEEALETKKNQCSTRGFPGLKYFPRKWILFGSIRASGHLIAGSDGI